MPTDYSITDKFGGNLAGILSDKLLKVYPEFKSAEFVKIIEQKCVDKTYTQRVDLLADELKKSLPMGYPEAISVLMQILEEENPNETGMFTNFYWILPIGKFVEKYGLNHLDLSLDAIEEITKRNTGEYAIRPFIRKYPEESLKRIKQWALSDNFHLRRLASEGLRPKLPWAPKLDVFIEKPEPVFQILEMLKEDPVKFVKKSVANHLTDYIKVNPSPTKNLIRQWSKTDNPHTMWIIKHATRKFPEILE
ncbi:DNA alkylation repair protein [Alkalitalea saponilacus]|uniref:3-methyladenine DNA glycosylase AlkC n=1 Tax=Alkalitalea saponilacus TaxID=889453 RepID=A0A1T5HSD5_9BACT|nr:DNA alkylation repair protein [Alkalitalea saponilacus]ASB48374.1 3-methyladenine DNA glycosylase [Alkalitalea saponilacus]SKC23606.1 3-methyladenine DNA glycosylase AlkC [Alkalitalea saponilacus]